MEFTYEVITDDFDNKLIKRTDKDGSESWIPIDEGNTDYQAYLKSLDEAAPL